MSSLYNFGIGFANFTPFGSNAAGSPTPTQYLVVQDISIECSFTQKPLIGQLTFPVAVARGEGKIDIKVKYGRIGLKTLNDSIFAGTVATGETIIAVNESHATGTSSITVTNSATFAGDQGVLDGVGNPMELTTSTTPPIGFYAVNNTTGVYTVNSAQTGTALLISYAYTAATGYNVAVPNKPMGQSPQCKMWVANDNWTNNLAFLIPSVVFTKLSMPQKNTDWTLIDSEAAAYSDSANNILYMYGDIN